MAHALHFGYVTHGCATGARWTHLPPYTFALARVLPTTKLENTAFTPLSTTTAQHVARTVTRLYPLAGHQARIYARYANTFTHTHVTTLYTHAPISCCVVRLVAATARFRFARYTRLHTFTFTHTSAFGYAHILDTVHTDHTFLNTFTRGPLARTCVDLVTRDLLPFGLQDTLIYLFSQLLLHT